MHTNAIYASLTFDGSGIKVMRVYETCAKTTSLESACDDSLLLLSFYGICF